MPHRLTHVQPAAPGVLPSHRETRRELARERADRPAELRDLVAGGADELEIFGERTHAVAGDRPRPPALLAAAPPPPTAPLSRSAYLRVAHGPPPTSLSR